MLKLGYDMGHMRIEVRRHQVNAPWTYALLDQRQREIAAGIGFGGSGCLLLSEVSPVITVGRRTPKADYECAQDLEIFPTDRGGLATWHGPGQWVLFVVERLERLTGDTRGVRRAVDSLLEVAKKVADRYGVDAEIRDGCELGVWTQSGKFAAVGVHASQGVLLHGLSLNGFQTPGSFQGLRPCGLNLPVDFLLADSDCAKFEQLGECIVSTAQAEFGLGHGVDETDKNWLYPSLLIIPPQSETSQIVRSVGA